MSLALFNNGVLTPAMPRMSLAMADNSSTALTATGQKVCYLGRMWNKDRANKTLVGVGLCFGAITKAGGSGLTISQQGISHTSGPAFQPDGVQSQTWAVANANASFATNTWLNTSDNAGVALNYGAEVAIVVEYDASGRLGSDSVTVRGLTSSESGPGALGGSVYYNGTTWAILSVIPNLTLKFSDGTYGTIDGGIPHSNIGSQNIATGGTVGVGLEFTVPYACQVAGCWATLLTVTNADFALTLYSGNTSLASTSCDGNAISQSGAVHNAHAPLSPQALAAATTYRLGVIASTATAMTTYYLDLNIAAHRQALPRWFGEAGAWNTWNGTAWGSPATTRVPFIGLDLSQFDSGGGSGGYRPRLRTLGN